MKASLVPKSIAPLTETVASTIEMLHTTLEDIQQVHGALPVGPAHECELVDWTALLQQVEHLGRATQHVIDVAERQKSSLLAMKALARKKLGEVKSLDRMFSLPGASAAPPASPTRTNVALPA